MLPSGSVSESESESIFFFPFHASPRRASLRRGRGPGGNPSRFAGPHAGACGSETSADSSSAATFSPSPFAFGPSPPPESLALSGPGPSPPLRGTARRSVRLRNSGGFTIRRHLQPFALRPWPLALRLPRRASLRRGRAPGGSPSRLAGPTARRSVRLRSPGGFTIRRHFQPFALGPSPPSTPGPNPAS